MEKIISLLSKLSDNGGCIYRFSSDDGTINTIKLNAAQDLLYKKRLIRKFSCGNLAEYKSRINKCASINEVNKLGKEQDICDVCDFSSLSLDAAKAGLLAVLGSVVRFPELRSKICFVGSDIALTKVYERLERKDRAVPAEFGLNKIITGSEMTGLARMIKGSISGTAANLNMACAFSFGGFFDGIILRKKEFSEASYKETLSNLYYGVNRSFAPMGCYTVKSVIDHEIGHMLDFSRAVTDRKEVKAYYNSLNAAEIKNSLSEYASTSIREFIAEGYAEFCNHYPPREMAKKVARFIWNSKNK